MASALDGFPSGASKSDHSISAWLSYVQALPAHFIHRVRTGGVRFLIQVVLASLAAFVFFRLLTADSGRRYQAVFPWTGPHEEGEPGIDGGLRIVAFGSQDVYGSAPRSSESSQTWLQTLCAELECTSLHSFVPHHDSERVLAFTELYKKEVEELQQHTEEADLLKEPAADYSWLAEQFPVPSQAPDLPSQVDTFLSLPLPEEVPRQTLWVFTFGTWDIWRLAALPMDNGLQKVIEIADKLIEYIEILNFKSLDPESVAFSDFWFNATDAEIKELAAANAADKVDTRRLESFRVIVPQLFDISLAPGWQDRPAPLFPHTKGEQMRNAAVLTKMWNQRIEKKLKQWELKGSTKPNVTENDDGTFSAAPMPYKDDDDKEKRAEHQKRETIYAPYPRRMAFQPKIADDVIDAMTEEGMRRANVQDSLGHGTWPLNDSMRFLDVWKPCMTSAENGEGNPSECENPTERLFHDGFTISQRASDEVAKRTADEVIKSMFRKPKAKVTAKGPAS